ncbi:MAG: hypothetical protein LBU34_10915 [Planctomycetaceae bacterium]|nr:hypothetical protein [Planctomycetaceae bacterium]
MGENPSAKGRLPLVSKPPAVALRFTIGYAHLALAGLGKNQMEKESF